MASAAGRAGPFSATTSLGDLPALLAERDANSGDRALADPLDARDADEILAAVRPAIGDLADRVLDELESRAAGPLRGSLVGRDIRKTAREALEQFVAAAVAGRPEMDRSLIRELGRRHARVGLPLSELVTMVGQGALACWRGVLDLRREGMLSTDMLLPSSQLVFGLAQELSDVAIEGYVEAMDAVGAAPQARQVEIVRRLLDGEAPDLAQLQAQAATVGWTVPTNLVVAVVAAHPEVGATTPWPSRALAAPQGALWCVVLPAGHVELPVPEDASAAVGPVVPWHRARESLLVARDLLELGDARAQGPRVHRVADAGIDLLLARHPDTVGEMVRGRLGPLLELPEARRGPLLATLEAWLRRPGQLTSMAADLGVHVRSVRYRIERLRELLGPPVDDPEQRLALALAVRAAVSEHPLSLGPAADAPPGPRRP